MYYLNSILYFSKTTKKFEVNDFMNKSFAIMQIFRLNFLISNLSLGWTVAHSM